METNQLLKLTFESCEVDLLHNTAYGDLSKVLHAANEYRLKDKDGKAIQLASLLNSVGFTRQCQFLESDPDFKLDARGPWYKVGKGVNTRTEAHLLLLLYVAQVVSPRFHYEFNKRVVLENLCKWRDDSGDSFVALNAVVNAHSQKILGKEAHQGHFIQIAKRAKARIAPDGDNWNTASAYQLRERTRIESQLIKLIELGLVRDWEHLRELVDKV